MTNEDHTDSPDTTLGGGDDETTVVPDIHPTQTAPELAWSSSDDTDEIARRSWRQTLGISAAVLVSAGLLAITFGAGWLMHRSPPESHPKAKPSTSAPAPAPSFGASAPPVAPAGPRAARPDDDEFVALAISPSALGAAYHAGFGTSGTQDKANRIALSECKADSGNDDCLLVNAGMFHGCVSYAIDSSKRNWASGAGTDSAAAIADALRRLGIPAHGSYAQCSDPPGLIRSGESSPEPPPPSAASAPNGPNTDKQFIAMIHERGITTSIGSEAEIRAAHTVCGLMDQGQTAPQIVPQLQAQNPGMGASGAQSFVDSAIAIYCPQYAP